MRMMTRPSHTHGSGREEQRSPIPVDTHRPTQIGRRGVLLKGREGHTGFGTANNRAISLYLQATEAPLVVR